MKDYRVSYYLGDMLHTYIITAESEIDAIVKVMRAIPATSRKIFNNFKVERYYEEWN